MIDLNQKIGKYKQLAIKEPKYYVSIGDLYTDEADFNNAIVYYQKAIDNGFLAYAALGDCFDYKHEYKKSFDNYIKGTQKGEVECFEKVAYCYYNGHHVNEDIEKAIEYYTKGSTLGSARASRSLAICIILICQLKNQDLTTLIKL